MLFAVEGRDLGGGGKENKRYLICGGNFWYVFSWDYMDFFLYNSSSKKLFLHFNAFSWKSWELCMCLCARLAHTEAFLSSLNEYEGMGEQCYFYVHVGLVLVGLSLPWMGTAVLVLVLPYICKCYCCCSCFPFLSKCRTIFQTSVSQKKRQCIYKLAKDADPHGLSSMSVPSWFILYKEWFFPPLYNYQVISGNSSFNDSICYTCRWSRKKCQNVYTVTT